MTKYVLDQHFFGLEREILNNLFRLYEGLFILNQEIPYNQRLLTFHDRTMQGN